MTLFYMGLEPYKARYTLQLTEWNVRAFNRRGVPYCIVGGQTLSTDQAIVTGAVLDAHGRSYFSLSQMMSLVKLMKEGKVTSNDVILFEDMFAPGIESLPYILDQVPSTMIPKVFVRCLAQSIDPDDFVNSTGMAIWMRHYEAMVNRFVTGVLATNEEMAAYMHVAGWTAPIYNIAGLAFGKKEVQSRVQSIKDFKHRPMRVGFAARWDREKQPDFFMDLVEYYRSWMGSSIEFAVYCGGRFRSNDHALIERARALQATGALKIYEDLAKDAYYEHLNNTRVLFNCALQDWVSNTVSEADALGCNVLYPAYRSFPETFANDQSRLYVPWSLDDALSKLKPLLEEPHPMMGRISDWNDQTIDRTIDIIAGDGEQWRRDDVGYRVHTRHPKY